MGLLVLVLVLLVTLVNAGWQSRVDCHDGRIARTFVQYLYLYVFLLLPVAAKVCPAS